MGTNNRSFEETSDLYTASGFDIFGHARMNRLRKADRQKNTQSDSKMDLTDTNMQKIHRIARCNRKNAPSKQNPWDRPSSIKTRPGRKLKETTQPDFRSSSKGNTDSEYHHLRVSNTIAQPRSIVENPMKRTPQKATSVLSEALPLYDPKPC